MDVVMRKLFPIACVLSLLLCAGLGMLWLRSYWSNEEAHFRYRGELCRLWVRSGRVGFDNEPEVQTFFRPPAAKNG